MKILYVSHSFGAWGSQDQVWDRNLRDSLIFQGHELIGPSYDQDQAHIECTNDHSGEARARYSQRLLDSVRSLLANGHLDLIFTYFDNRNVLPEALDEIRRFGVPTVNFFCNAAHEFYKVDQVAAHFDYCVVPEITALEYYRNAGACPIHLQMAANPRFYRHLELPYLYQVTFIGTKYLNREEHLLQLSRKGYDVHAFGALWPLYKPSLSGTKPRQIPRRLAAIAVWPLRVRLSHVRGSQLPASNYHPPVSDEEMVRIFNQSKVVLGLSDVLDENGNIIRHIRLRDFEVPMCGSFYLTGSQEELFDYYEIGKEIECYSSYEELIEKTTFYLRNETSRKKIARAGLLRAINEHTWENRFQRLFSEIGLPQS